MTEPLHIIEHDASLARTAPASGKSARDAAGETTRRGDGEPGLAGGRPAAAVADVRSVDRELLLCLRSGQSKSIGELMDMLGVTATAVRQRIDRLLELQLIDREKVVAGRGRPTFRYLLTVSGYRRAGADAADFAEAMWREILQFPEPSVRETLVSAVAQRLGRQLAAAIDAGQAGTTGAARDADRPDAGIDAPADAFVERMRRLSDLLQAREIPAAVRQSGELPVLDVDACPYPNLTDASDDRTMCRLEEQMLSEALGETVRLNRCRLDGDSCCQFTASTVNGSTADEFTVNGVTLTESTAEASADGAARADEVPGPDESSRPPGNASSRAGLPISGCCGPSPATAAPGPPPV